MVSCSNGGLSGDILNKRPLENGYVPNWKPRKVSAVRDFPPLCGHNTVSMNLEPAENTCSRASVIKSEMANAAVMKDVNSFEMVDLKKPDEITSEIPKVSKLDGIKNSSIVTVMGNSVVKNTKIEVECWSHEAVNNSIAEELAESLDSLVGKVITVVMDGFSNGVEELKMETRPLEFELPNEVESDSHEPVRNPVEVDIAESLDAVVGNVTTMAVHSPSDGSEELIHETRCLGVGLWNDLKSDAFSKVPEDGGQTAVNELNEVGHLKLVRNSIVKGKPLLDVGASVDEVVLSGHSQSSSSPPKGPNVSNRLEVEPSPRPKDKYQQRRVSATRDFPPLCGSNVPQPIKEERQKFISRNDCQVEVKTEVVMLRNDPDRGEPGEMLMTRVCLDRDEKVDVKTETTEKLSCGAGREPSGETTRATMESGLMSSKEFDESVQDSKIEKPEEKRAVPGSGGNMPKAVLGNSDEDAEGSVGKEVVVYSPGRSDKMRPSRSVFSSVDEVDRKVAYGVMATPGGSQRKVKVHFNNSDGGTSGGKVRKQNFSWRHKVKTVAKKSNPKAKFSGGPSMKQKVPVSSDADGSPSALMFTDKEGYGCEVGLPENSSDNHKLQDFDVSLPPFGPKSSSRDKIRPSRGVSTGNEVHWEIGQGLMAAPYCPWRKRKGTLINSEGGTSEGKVIKQNLSWQQESIGFTSKNILRADCSGLYLKKAAPVSSGADGNLSLLIFMDKEHHGAYDKILPETTLISMSKAVLDDSDEDTEGPVGKEVVVYSPGRSDKMRPSLSVFSSVDEVDRKVAYGVMAAPDDSQRKVKVDFNNSDGRTSRGKVRKQKFSWRHKVKTVAKKNNPKARFSGEPSMKQKVPVSSDADGSPGALLLTYKEGYGREVGLPENSPDNHNHKLQDFDVALPPFGPKSSSHGDARNRVRETLRLFHAICRKLLQEEEAKSMPEEGGKLRQPRKGPRRIDLLATKIIKDKGKEVNIGKILGEVPGVEVGDEFQYRVELAVVGIHRLYQNGIDSIKLNDNMSVAISIVASGAYGDDMENGDVLIYSGQGGNVVEKDKEPEDQKLEKGNLALRNSISAKTPVRVVRGWKVKGADSLDSKSKIVTTYVYDGLYTVKNYWTETGSHGKLVFMFELWRNPGQPDLAWKELKKSSKSKIRPGVCVTDISGGKEPFPISAVNIFNDEKLPPFNYISKMMYPDWYHPISPEGCDCTGRCSDSRKCRCAVKNGGEIPYNRNGAIVEVKPLVYECGPSCRCPPSCYNRVGQRGIKFQFEIFKTESRGWGVRSLNSIPSGCFICEYSGELLEDKEAELRIDNDEYLFDIGQIYSDSSLKPGEQANLVEFSEGGYTIDAGRYGNVGRFINHSCSPNLYAQNVIYDHNDKKMPHVMFFAAENIPPLQELTYHYNYTVDEVRDSNGNIKIKKCYCGSAECTGRMY